MPTISQLPPANTVSAADEVPISQAGTARAVSVGTLLASVQPVITVESPSLLGRTSIGSGGPEQVMIGPGLIFTNGMLTADGFDPAALPVASGLPSDADLVISKEGSPMLMQASLMRGLFSAGQNIVIDPNGAISATSDGAGSGSTAAIGSIGSLPVVDALSPQDLIAVYKSGLNSAISSSNLLDGITIDQAQTAGPASDFDVFWAAQGSNVMASQTLGAVWVWIANKLPTHKTPVIEISGDTNLDATVHNGRLLICSQPITLTPLTVNMGSGFQCTVLNASSGNLVLSSRFVTSSGSFVLTPWQSATLSCATYSAGTIAFAAMPTTSSTLALLGQVNDLSTSAITSSTISLTWQAPLGGGSVGSYVVQYRVAGTSGWTSTASILGTTTQLTTLQSATSYEIAVVAQNAAGLGLTSAILTVATSGTSQIALPAQVTGVVATPMSATAVQVSWSGQTGNSAATSFTIQYRVTGSSTWTSSVAGIIGTTGTIAGLTAATSYDFSVTGVNSSGAGPASSSVSVATLAASQSVTSITWNVVPAGTYTHGSGAIGVNAQVLPASAPVQFGFSPSASAAPSSWISAILVNTNLWGAYVPTPATPGSWFTWAEGLDGSAQTVSPTPFLVQ